MAKKPQARKVGSGKQPGDDPLPEIPSGRRLTAAQQSLRDSLMLTRKTQGWTNEEIGEEAGISVSQVKRAIGAKKAAMPDLLSMDPLQIVGELVEGFQASIGDFEKMAAGYAINNPSAAVGAKKAADDARRNLATLLQATGTLPRELGTLRHIVDVKVVVAQLVDAVEGFQKNVEGMKLPNGQRKKVLAAANEVRGQLAEIAGEEA